MDYKITKINMENYSKFDDMIFWRVNGVERKVSNPLINVEIIEELANPNLYIYAIQIQEKYIAYIELVYIPKVGKYNGHGHIYVDELWVQPAYRNQGFAKTLMKKADELAINLKAKGVRLYVNIDNLNAQNLYSECGYSNCGTAYFMEK